MIVGGTTDDTPRTRGLVFVTVALGVAAVLAFAALLVATNDRKPPPQAPELWPGRIGNTWSKTRNAFVGTFAYAGPDTAQRVGAGYPEGTQVKVTCFRKGRAITDPTLQTTSDVWYRLSDGNWISKLYFVPDPASDKAADTIPRCE